MNEKICYFTQTIKELIHILNNQPAGFAFILEDSNKLIGIITDGDIRRALLDGYGLKSLISDLNIQMCKFAFIDEDYSKIIEKLNNQIRVLPLLNREYKLVDYIQLDKRSYMPIAEPILNGNELKYVTNALLSTWISSAGEYIDKFESDFSKYIGLNHGVSTSNGTSALHLALMALGIKDGDEVIVPDLTFAATINAVLHANAVPVIVDVEEDSWCIDPQEIKKVVTPKTKAIIPVHLYGQACDMKQIMDIAREYNLYVIEDCAEAHGAEYNNKKVGSFGDISCFSFFGNKIITTGEGGMCLTNSDNLNLKIRQLRDHGMSMEKKYWHEVVGYNYRMTNIQAAIGCAQLEKIDNILENRDLIEQRYFEIFKKYKFIKSQKTFINRKKVTWLVSVIIEDIDTERVIKIFKENSVDVRQFFYPLSDMPIYKKYAYLNNLNTRHISKNGLSFPTHSRVDFKKIDLILEDICKLSK